MTGAYENVAESPHNNAPGSMNANPLPAGRRTPRRKHLATALISKASSGQPSRAVEYEFGVRSSTESVAVLQTEKGAQRRFAFAPS